VVRFVVEPLKGRVLVSESCVRVGKFHSKKRVGRHGLELLYDPEGILPAAPPRIEPSQDQITLRIESNCPFRGRQRFIH
jgi:hypothetical protein